MRADPLDSAPLRRRVRRSAATSWLGEESAPVSARVRVSFPESEEVLDRLPRSSTVLPLGLLVSSFPVSEEGLTRAPARRRDRRMRPVRELALEREPPISRVRSSAPLRLLLPATAPFNCRVRVNQPLRPLALEIAPFTSTVLAPPSPSS